jgi:alanine-alpha-ketoisovalerate/valine-pyruvate aminotransferase
MVAIFVVAILCAVALGTHGLPGERFAVVIAYQIVASATRKHSSAVVALSFV